MFRAMFFNKPYKDTNDIVSASIFTLLMYIVKFIQSFLFLKIYKMLKEYQMASAEEAAVELQATKSLFSQFRDHGMQTMYRESEAQTDPYSPEYTIRAGDNPKVLLLANLTFGKGLPAGQKEVELIERSQARQVEEAKMATMGLSERKRVRARLEAEEWEYRAHEIEALVPDL